ncbi:hypothetical protein HEP84_11420 [Streptomyces sp. RLB1-33]|uniref:8-oxoguanine DNA glycosylase OGG fold protein n=1 Tax=Streptomyces mirabilis TaxID=68239 RepID=UPI00143E75B4|nr:MULTISPECIES: hypothetical protein [Streptomyces]QIY69680.1 hypothetical protein HEP84_11420 [Streptomyces sp. RLB1-33]QUW83466.1 hypothetical protein SMIR_33490 [Streptomyces mirabilis]
MGRQDLADVLDGEMLRRPLPTAAVTALVAWLNGAGARYAVGTGGHAVEYVPAHWSAIEPWPARLAERACAQICTVSRERVVAAVRETLAREDWAEALVASYVWGQGRTGYGPYRLKEILGTSGVGDVLAQAGHAFREEGAVGAYRVLNGAVQGLGPAFFTKYLYFLDAGMDGAGAENSIHGL